MSTTDGTDILTATVSSSTGGTPTGTVAFYDATSGVVLTTVNLSGGSVSYTLPSTVSPNDAIVAVYSGDSTYGSAASGTVTAMAIATKTIAAPTSVSYSSYSSVEYDVDVANSNGGQDPTGVVDVYDATTKTDLTPGGVSLNDTGSDGSFAEVTLSQSPNAGDVVIVSYLSNSSGFANSSTSFTNPADTTTALTISGNYIDATVSSSSYYPTGSLTFTDETTGATVTEPLSYGSASYNVSTLTTAKGVAPSAGDVITATYVPTGGYAASSASATIASVTTSMSLVIEPTYIQAVVTGDPSSGTVNFYDGSTLLGSESVSDGDAALYASETPSGSLPSAGNVITADYSGGTGYIASSASATVPAQSSQVVLTLSITNGAVVLTATVSSSSGGTPTGTVTFYDASQNDISLTSKPIDLNDVGIAMCTPSYVSPNDAIVAVYSGDSTYAPSASGIAIALEPTTTTVSISTTGGNSTVSATVTAGGAAVTTGLVDFYVEETTGSGMTTNSYPGSFVNGMWSYSTASPLSAGAVVIAEYTGSSTAAPSTASTVVAQAATATTLSTELELTATPASPNGGTVSFYDETTGGYIQSGTTLSRLWKRQHRGAALVCHGLH